ncbi:MAG: GNAT family N-acetyltransferase [Chloroflexota bacterium]|nr:GNAT family N-acetyltransferase [Chloroflexota bacterium]
MTTAVGSYAVEPLDAQTASDADLNALAGFGQAMDAERMPEDPPTPLPLRVRRLRNRPPTMEPRRWVVREGSLVIASAALVRWTNLTNPDWRELAIDVRADRRRRGIARTLLATAAGVCGDGIVLSFDTSDRVPAGAGFAKRIGAKAGLEARISETRLAELDRAMVAEWARIDPAGYRLVWIDDDIPGELLENVLVAYNAMNTAPKGALTFGEETATAEMVRGWERMRHRNGGLQRIALAVHEATGETAGYTEVARHPDTPWIVGQHGTAVIPAHRGRGIGKWLKARMIERIVAEWPDAERIRTGNAYVNAPMLSINDRLGFRVTFSATVWEIAIARVRDYLAG